MDDLSKAQGYSVQVETAMVFSAQDDKLQAVVARLVRAAPVEEIILFGSRGRGDHHDDSDYDLCVILSDDIAAGRFTAVTLWREVADSGLALNIVPLRKSRFACEQHNPLSLSHEIAETGRIVFRASGSSPLS